MMIQMIPRLILGVAALGLAVTARTADADPAPPTVPAIESDSASALPLPPPPINLLSGREAPLTARERASVAIANDWKTEDFQPGRGANGQVLYRFGAALPTVVCAPLYVCAIQLQPGETVNAMNVGDAVRWIITPAISGSGASQATNVIVKVTDTDLMTNLVISTDRRTYVIKLVSRKNDWMPFVAFSYPEDEAAQWALARALQDKTKAATVLPDTGRNLATLDFGFRLSGDAPSWRPLRVYTDGVKTYIQFPTTMQHGDAPALVALGQGGGLFSGPSMQLVNYRVTGDRYVVDKVLDRAALISGVGNHQVKVEITREAEATP